MELIRISDSKLKIMLTPVDMRQFELNTDNFYDDGEQMHRSFRLLLDEVFLFLRCPSGRRKPCARSGVACRSRRHRCRLALLNAD